MPYWQKKTRWLTELLQGALLPVRIVHFMGRCYIATIWALAKCPYPYPSRISRVYCNLICFDKLIPIQPLSPLWAVPLPSTWEKVLWLPNRWVTAGFRYAYILISFPPCLDEPSPGRPALFFYLRLLDKYYFLYVLWSEKPLESTPLTVREGEWLLRLLLSICYIE